MSDEESSARIKTFLCFWDGQNPSRIELKRFCAENLTAKMILDFSSFLDDLPKTSTEKTDYQKLQSMD